MFTQVFVCPRGGVCPTPSRRQTGGYAQPPPPGLKPPGCRNPPHPLEIHGIWRDTVNKRTVRFLLECILLCHGLKLLVWHIAMTAGTHYTWCLITYTRKVLHSRFITARKESLGEGNIFAPVCHSVHSGGGSASVHAGIPPWTRHPPEQTPPAQCMLGDTVNKQTVCILLECNLVSKKFCLINCNVYKFGKFVISIFRAKVEVLFKLKRNVCGALLACRW